MTAVTRDEFGRPLPAWMREHLDKAIASPGLTVAELAELRASQPPPLALKLCAGCTRQYAVEGDVGDEQGGTAWFCARCPVPPCYQDAAVRDASLRMGRAS